MSETTFVCATGDVPSARKCAVPAGSGQLRALKASAVAVGLGKNACAITSRPRTRSPGGMVAAPRHVRLQTSMIFAFSGHGRDPCTAETALTAPCVPRAAAGGPTSLPPPTVAPPKHRVRPSARHRRNGLFDAFALFRHFLEVSKRPCTRCTPWRDLPDASPSSVGVGPTPLQL